ncbi:hypothetical protein [Xanthomonas phaseoli]|uniref:hypothetical protein n=1 Tax=Xanthomonas phaseoli TaxID=1985254 RepID=UPI0013302117|nr:hypothetical protein [Xanthomonas phaseoli]
MKLRFDVLNLLWCSIKMREEEKQLALEYLYELPNPSSAFLSFLLAQIFAKPRMKSALGLAYIEWISDRRERRAWESDDETVKPGFFRDERMISLFEQGVLPNQLMFG